MFLPTVVFDFPGCMRLTSPVSVLTSGAREPRENDTASDIKKRRDWKNKGSSFISSIKYAENEICVHTEYVSQISLKQKTNVALSPG